MDIEKLFDYLDWYDFVNYDEVSDCVSDYFMEEEWQLNPSLWDLLDHQDYAIEYIIARNLEFEPDVVNWEDLNNVEEWKKIILLYKQRKWKNL